MTLKILLLLAFFAKKKTSKPTSCNITWKLDGISIIFGVFSRQPIHSLAFVGRNYIRPPPPVREHSGRPFVWIVIGVILNFVSHCGTELCISFFLLDRKSTQMSLSYCFLLADVEQPRWNMRKILNERAQLEDSCFWVFQIVWKWKIDPGYNFSARNIS